MSMCSQILEFDDNNSNNKSESVVKSLEEYENRLYPMDIRYVWNWSLLKDFYQQQIEPFWTLIAIQGYF